MALATPSIRSHVSCGATDGAQKMFFKQLHDLSHRLLIAPIRFKRVALDKILCGETCCEVRTEFTLRHVTAAVTDDRGDHVWRANEGIRILVVHCTRLPGLRVCESGDRAAGN